MWCLLMEMRKVKKKGSLVDISDIVQASETLKRIDKFLRHTTICSRTLTPTNTFKGFCRVIPGLRISEKQSTEFRGWRCCSTSKSKMRSSPPLLRTKCLRGLFRNSPPSSDALLMATCR